MRLILSAAAVVALTLSSSTAASAFLPTLNRLNHNCNAPFADRSRCHISSHRRPALVRASTLSATPDDTSESETKSGGASIPSGTVTSEAKSRVLTLARRLSPQDGGDSASGVFVTDPDQKSELRRAVAELEAVSGATGERQRQLMVGDWTLLCTTNTPSGRPGGMSSVDKREGGGKKKKRGLPFKLPENPAREVQERIRDKVRKSFEVTQRIRTSEEEEGSINRVDNVIEFSPPFETLSDILPDSPLDALKNLKLNPLEVKKSKVSLIHDANVESTTPVLRTKISLKSIVLTIAGTSQYLEPEGADVLGLNVPLGEFLNGGYFDTTYVDENMRISRGSVGPTLDILRVFKRGGMYEEPIENAEADMVDHTPDESEPEVTDELQSGAEKLRDAVGDAVTDVVEIIDEDVKEIREKVEDVRDVVLGVAQDIVNVTAEDLKEVRKSVEAVGSVVEDAAENLAVSVSDSAVVVQKAAGDLRDAARGQIDEVAEDARDEVERAVKELEDQAEETLAAAVGKEDAGKMREAVDGAVEDVVDSVKNVTEALQDVVDDVATAVEGGIDNVQEVATDATAAMSDDMDNVRKAVEDVVEDAAEAVRPEAGKDDEDKTGEDEEKDDKEGK
uniref:Plastid lipid-associated protein/fibrillin conserved domain-containing protein n=1 Tax=Odontella aurita TaxID=265563 RepID=A0A7S4HR44_9STRA|mmetsp:Transcript_13928/g.40752  ORF Transcript_13928/g.40752 Transcript_13928/m.40752 type:complete len:620 (+) Transcript_13928:155-2014(+)